MYEIKSMIIQFSQWLYPWITEISMAIMATLLVIYGAVINRVLKKQTSGMHFIFRITFFILLCSFGYGAILVYGTPLLTKMLASLGMIYFGPLVVCVFIALGIVAEKKNHI